MAYAFNDNKSKADVYTKAEIDTQFSQIEKRLWPQAYAVLDENTGLLTFFRDTENKWADKQRIGGKVYFTNFEQANPSFGWLDFAYRRNIKRVDMQNSISVRTLASFFENCENITTVSLDKLDSSMAVSANRMFGGCGSITTLDLSYLNLQLVQDMSLMFGGCLSLKNIKLGNTFSITMNVRNMSGMFIRCYSLETVDISQGINTYFVTDTNQMFYECRKLKTIYVNEDIVNLDNVTNSNSMFYGCVELVGGKGTTFDNTKINKEYARVDNPPDEPGYFSK